MSSDLDRFVAAQHAVFEHALGELRMGRKRSHWMWFVFPQLAGLGRSETSRFFGLESLTEARAYLEHPILGARLHDAARALLESGATNADEVFGRIDAMKLRSSMTLFRRAAPGDPLFRDVLERFYDGQADPATDELLEAQRTRQAQ